MHPSLKVPVFRWPVLLVGAFVVIVLLFSKALVPSEDRPEEEKSRGTFRIDLMSRVHPTSVEAPEDVESEETSPEGPGSLFTPNELAAFKRDARRVVQPVEAASASTQVAAVRSTSSPGVDQEEVLRRRLLERAGQLSLRGEEPWTGLVEVALSYRRVGDERSMNRWFDRAQRLATDPDDPVESSVAMRSVVNGLLSARQHAEASSLVMRIPDPALRERAKAEVAGVLARQKNFEAALRLSGTLNDPKSHAAALGNVAVSLAHHAEVRDALAVTSRIPDPGLRDDSLMKVALTRAGAGDIAAAAGIARGISDTGVREVAFSRLAEHQSSDAKSPWLQMLFSSVRNPTLRDAALRRIVQKRVQRQDLEGAEEALLRIGSAQERASGLEAIASLQARRGDVSAALTHANAIGVEPQRNKALQSIALAENRRRGANRARNVANMITDVSSRDVTLRRIAEQSINLGDDRAAVSVASGIVSPETRTETLLSLSRIHASHGAILPARRLIRDAERELQRIDRPAGQWRALSALALAHAEAHDYSGALAHASRIQDSGTRDGVHRQLARKLASDSEFDLAGQSARAITAEALRVRTLDDVARSLASQTRATDAMRRVNELHSPRERVRFLIAVAQRI